jgi:hypothetical protein
VNCANVNILISADGGNTFKMLLANTPNDGSQAVAMPSVLGSKYRIKVEAVGNIFFDISNADFTLSNSGSVGISAKSAMIAQNNPNGLDDAMKINVYPNPAGNLMQVSIENSNGHAVLKMYNMSGRLVKEQNMDQQVTELNISNLPAGLYMIHVNDDTESKTVKFIKN